MVGFERVCANAGIVSRGRATRHESSDVQIARYLGMGDAAIAGVTFSVR